MKYLLILTLTGLMFTASCESKAMPGTEGMAKRARVLFLDGKGAGISLEAAFKASHEGETVYRCQPVKASLNKSGTSISFKVVK